MGDEKNKYGDDFDGDGLDLARCAQINIENAVKLMPLLPTMNPLFKMAQEQLAAAVKRLEDDDG